MCCVFLCLLCLFFFFKQKTAYEMRISDWSSDVCSSDLLAFNAGGIQFRDVKIGKSSLAVVLQDSKLTADLAEMQLYEGSGTGQVVVDGSSGQPAIAADFDLVNFQAGPFLNDLAKFDRILGTTESKLSVRTEIGSAH